MVLFWFVALQGLSPFLHAHVGTLPGDGAGFLHQHEPDHDAPGAHPARFAAVLDHASHPGHGVVCAPLHSAEVLVAQALPPEGEQPILPPSSPAAGSFGPGPASRLAGRLASVPVAAPPPYLLPPGLAPPVA